MAYTSIIPVHRLDNSLRYVQDKEKTSGEKNHKGAGSLEEAIDYAMNREKTESQIYESALGCTCESAFSDMAATKERFRKQGGVQGYHLIQSFAVGEVTPQMAHAIGVELAEQLLKGKFEAVVTTHLNTDHYHNHIVFNSVSIEDGHKYHSNSRSYYEDVRQISDRLCKKYGLSIITPKGRGMDYSQWQAEQQGNPTWRSSICSDIREAVSVSFTWRQFLQQMEKRGYEWKLNRKYIALKAPGMERFVRLKSLGKSYSEHAIREWLLSPHGNGRPGNFLSAGKEEKGAVSSSKTRKKYTGLLALYYHYLYLLGAFPDKPKRKTYVLKADIRKLDERIAQMEFLQKRGITTREQLLAYRKPLEEQVLSLMKERYRLYRTEPGAERIGEITEQLKPLRQEIRMCVKIAQHSKEIERRLEEERAFAKAQEEKEMALGSKRTEKDREERR